MGDHFKSLLIVADIEGSSGCWDHAGSSFMTDAWFRACAEMTLDVNAVVTALFDAGIDRVTVQDFHRTGYNLLPERIDSRARVLSGYRPGPVPGIGSPGDAEAVMFLGMHAASGTEGFLAHTLTSRIKRLEVNGQPLAEVQLFAASLAPYGVKPIFFSGCPAACSQALQAIAGLDTYPIDKSGGPGVFDSSAWRSGLGCAAARSVNNIGTRRYTPRGPFRATLTMRDGECQARQLAAPWGFVVKGSKIFIETPDIHQLYGALIRLCYLTPLTERVLPFALFWHRVMGRFGLAMVRRHLKKNRPDR